jgi:Ser/Thr protein kinase RdoA (MazF antagonist)
VNTSQAPQELLEVTTNAARSFLGEEFTLTFLGHGESLTHRVDGAEGRFLLRVHSPVCAPLNPEFSTDAAIESECAWLNALCDETELVVQRPVPSPTGGTILSLPSASGEPVACTLLTWVEGESVEGKHTPEQAARLGELLAALHGHAQGWTPPPEFERPVLRAEDWRAGLERADGLVGLGLITRADHDLLARTVDQAEGELGPLEDRPERVGLIHGDLHRGNVVFHDGAPRPIDFGRAGFGPWLLDLAECVAGLGPARRRDMVEAYARRHPLEDGDLRHLEGYMAASLVETFGHHTPNPEEHDWLERAVPAWAPHMRRYVAGEPFLYEL